VDFKGVLINMLAIAERPVLVCLVVGRKAQRSKKLWRIFKMSLLSISQQWINLCKGRTFVKLAWRVNRA